MGERTDYRAYSEEEECDEEKRFTAKYIRKRSEGGLEDSGG